MGRRRKEREGAGAAKEPVGGGGREEDEERTPGRKTKMRVGVCPCLFPGRKMVTPVTHQTPVPTLIRGRPLSGYPFSAPPLPGVLRPHHPKRPATSESVMPIHPPRCVPDAAAEMRYVRIYYSNAKDNQRSTAVHRTRNCLCDKMRELYTPALPTPSIALLPAPTRSRQRPSKANCNNTYT